MADFYAARRGIIPPLPWSTFSPPFSAQVLLAVVRAPEDVLPAEIDDLLEEASMEALRAVEVSNEPDHWDGFCAALSALAGEARTEAS